MNEISRVLPISEAAMDVYNMTRTADWSLPQIAAAIQRDASLSAEVLRLGNSSLYNTTERKIKDLTEAVSRIGQQRVGELALTSSALASLSPAMLPWMDLKLTWKRSMAAGIALEMLIEAGGHSQNDDGLLLSAIMHPLGRVAFGALFPKQYESMVERCNDTNETLQEQERRIFPANHAEMAAQLLAAWQIPDEVIMPLKYSCDDFASIAQLSEPLRTRSELVKLAIVVGQLAVGKWQSWDTVQLPSAALMRRLGVRDVGNIIRDIRVDVEKLVHFNSDCSPEESTEEACEVEYTVAYCNIKGGENDLLPGFLRTMGIEIEAYPAAELRELEVPAIVNCLGTAATRFVARRNKQLNLAFVDSERREVFSRFGQAVAIPGSFARVREAVLEFLGRGEENATVSELVNESKSQRESGEAVAVETVAAAIGER
jgi:HD-like signal output (HDOD) protein